MLLVRHHTFLFAAAIVLVATSDPARSPAQDKKKAPAKVDPAIKAGEKVGPTWQIREARLGVKILADKDYVFAALPKEVAGGTFLLRSSPELGKWLTPGAVEMKADGHVYAVVLVSQFGKDKFPELHQQQFEKDGWKALADKVGTTFPSGEGWVWKAYKKEQPAGPVFLQLDTLSWDKHGTAVLYIFK
ncbi:MAG TPA: hypothetical protein VH092_22370 [Urbifossiella sp.]|jgi:hypothetical protein|nr:hypothetical protein [Urbifossiella sp.]